MPAWAIAVVVALYASQADVVDPVLRSAVERFYATQEAEDVAGYLSLWSVWWLFKQLTGKEGMGHGDFKLLAALGAWCGMKGILPIILMSSVLGALIGSIVVGLLVEVSTLWIPSDMKYVGALVVLIVILLFRPQGILGRRERIG